MGHSPEDWQYGAMGLGGSYVRYRCQGEQRLPDGAPPGFAAWVDNGGCADPTHRDIVERLEGVAMAATAKGAKSSEATLMT